MSLDYSRPWHPRSYPASSVRCRVCDRKFQAGHVPAGDPVCSECAREVTGGHEPGLFDVPDRDGGAGLL